MPGPDPADRHTLLARAIAALDGVRDPDQAVEILSRHARGIAGSEGITIVRLEGDQVHYLGEDAITPLWKGRRFQASQCVTGLAIMGGKPILIPDIRYDPRVPLELYVALFVSSLAVFPAGETAGIGAYWSTPGPIDPLAVELMTRLAEAARPAFATPPLAMAGE